jgi:DNA-binding NarL/FixJ family response regulator
MATPRGAAVFCLRCGSNCCLHIQRSHDSLLTPREVQILRALCDPNAGCRKEIAFNLGITHGTLKVYLSHIYRKLEWDTKSSVNVGHLVLFAIANREQLGIPLPTPEQFQPREEKAA